MKISMFEIEEFLKTLSDDWYIEDEGLLDDQYNDRGKLVNGNNIINVNKDYIEIVWQSEQDCIGDESRDFLYEFKKWKKSQTYVYITIEVDKSKLDEVTEILKKIPVKIVSR
jgi:hypothetical protein